MTKRKPPLVSGRISNDATLPRSTDRGSEILESLRHCFRWGSQLTRGMSITMFEYCINKATSQVCSRWIEHDRTILTNYSKEPAAKKPWCLKRSLEKPVAKKTPRKYLQRLLDIHKQSDLITR